MPFIAKLQSLEAAGKNHFDASQEYYHANDILIGSAGNDMFSGFGIGTTITSGDGADSFVFADASAISNNPSITDFASGRDQLQFSASALNVFLPSADVQTGDMLPILMTEDPYAGLNPSDLPAQGGLFLLDNAGPDQGQLYFSSIDIGLPQGFLALAQLQSVTQLTNNDFWIV